MSFELDALWQERHDDEHKIRRDDHRSPYQRDRARILHSAASVSYTHLTLPTTMLV